jgi:hypothetical protein
MLNSHPRRNQHLQADSATSTAPVQTSQRNTRSHTPPDSNLSPVNLGHFSAAPPDTYPVPPLVPTLYDLDPPNLSQNIISVDVDLFFLPPPPVSNPAVPPNHRPSAAIPPPAKRKKTKQKAPAVSLSDSLQGIGPVVSQPVPKTSSSPADISPVEVQLPVEPEDEEANYGSSSWEHVYPLDSNTMPTSRPVINGLLLRVKPKSAYVGCRICNQPGAGNRAS